MDDRVFKAASLEAGGLSHAAIREVVAQACSEESWRGQRVLVVIPDATRTAPVGTLFKALHECLRGTVRQLDVLVALGTHQPMSEEAICGRLEISLEQRRETYGAVSLYNHAWDDPQTLQGIGSIPAREIDELSEGRFSMDVPVEVNRRVFDYDRLVLLGPVFPHEVVGFSGGNKYLFPGISGPGVLNFFHWLGAVITTPRIIGNVWTPVRRVIDRAAALVECPKLGISMVVDPDGSLQGLFAGSPEAAWEAAVDLSQRRHITLKEGPFHTIVSCAPPMYDELWTGGKCMYKLEPVLADGGELIIYAPHIREISFTHRRWLDQVGYHCRDYFLQQWDQFKHVPWGVLAHSVHVHGLGRFESGVEQARARVTLATGIPEDRCRRVNLGYRDPASIRPEAFANREEEGILLVPKAGEMLFRLKNPPAWARCESSQSS